MRMASLKVAAPIKVNIFYLIISLFKKIANIHYQVHCTFGQWQVYNEDVILQCIIYYAPYNIQGSVVINLET